MKTNYIITFVASLLTALPSFGQNRQDRLSLIDSLSNPAVAEGSEVMVFENVRIEAGEMNEDSTPSEHVFRWKNEGKSPLSITWAQTTCGCAAPSYDRGLVQPGESASLKITYRPKGHPGGFLRKIFVYTNLSESKPTAVLELAGRVIPSVLPTADYPFTMGGLLLKRTSVAFEGDARQTERIECLNAGDKVLEISADPKALPKGVSVEPLTIEPGRIADLIIRFDPSAAGIRSELHAASRPAEAPLFLKGLNLPPTKCMITVNFKR